MHECNSTHFTWTHLVLLNTHFMTYLPVKQAAFIGTLTQIQLPSPARKKDDSF